MRLSIVKQYFVKVFPRPLIDILLYAKYRKQQLLTKDKYFSQVNGRRGVEIGGPSTIFKTVLPIYKKIDHLDGVNFSKNTMWEGDIQQGRCFIPFLWKRGVQFIADATDLSQIENQSYDLLVSSNCLEHVANPIKALLEWKRVMRVGAPIILVLPNKISNFDHMRPFTSFVHLLDDYRNETTEHDLTHLDEILALHDFSRDLPAGDPDNFRQRGLNNFINRGLHHHVFSVNVTHEMMNYVGFQIINTTETTDNLFFLGINSNK